MSERFVIAVSAVSGGGKTALVKKTAKLLGGTSLFFDDYVRFPNGYPTLCRSPKDLTQWLNNGANMNEWNTPQFVKFTADVAALKRGKNVVSPVSGENILSNEFIVIENPIGRCSNKMAEVINLMVVIDTPLDIALARRLLRDIDFLRRKAEEDLSSATKEGIIKQIFQSFGDQLQGYLDDGRKLYITVQKQVMSDCDLILDGRKPVE